MKLFNLSNRTVGRTVINYNNLKIVISLRQDRPQCLGYPFFLIIKRYDY